MKLFGKINLDNNTVLIVGALLVCVATYNSSYAAESTECNMVCKPMKTGMEECVWEPKGCKPVNSLKIPKSGLKLRVNPQLVNPQLINPERNILPGDAFMPGNKIKPKKLK